MSGELVQHNFWTLQAQRVMQAYMGRQDLVEQILQHMGAQDLRYAEDRMITCTCPLHNGEDPNFKVWFDRYNVPVWKCHSRCQDKGNLVRLVMKKYGVRYSEAVRWLASIIGVEIDGQAVHVDMDQLADSTLDAVRRLLKIDDQDQPQHFDEQMVAYSMQQLRQPGREHLVHYLTAPKTELSAWGKPCRQFPMAVLDYCEVGFVPAKAWTWPDVDPKTGQQRKNRAGRPALKGWYDDRISVTWRDIHGGLIGFAGRRIDGMDKQCKWVTLSGTRKQFALYGLHDPQVQEAIRSSRCCILVEGYMDQWRGRCHGIHNIVATGGTDLSPHQISLLQQFPLDHVALWYDGDLAGQRASVNMANQLLGFTVPKIVQSKQDEDPDDVLDPGVFRDRVFNASMFTGDLG